MILIVLILLVVAFALGVAHQEKLQVKRQYADPAMSQYVTRLEADLKGARETAEYWFNNHRLVVVSEAKKISALKRINDLCRKCDLISVAAICAEVLSCNDANVVSDSDLLDWIQDNAMVDFSFDDCTFKFPVSITETHRTVRQIIEGAMQNNEEFEGLERRIHPTLREALDETLKG